MANYLIQNTTLTSIADEVRTLSGTEETLSPDAMKEKVAESNENIAAEADLISQIQAALEGKSGGNSNIESCSLTIDSEAYGIRYIDQNGSYQSVDSIVTGDVFNVMKNSILYIFGDNDGHSSLNNFYNNHIILNHFNDDMSDNFIMLILDDDIISFESTAAGEET